MINNVCSTQKRPYDDETMAVEALIQWYIRNDSRSAGPTNVYQCEECGYWHFTSKGGLHEKLLDPEVKKYIEREKRAFEWEQKLK